ncbi:uncharacterized protein [Littorina saxatilis]
MVRGRWQQQEMSSSDKYEMDLFHMKVRLELGLPKGLQRPDLKCGNVTFGSYSPPMHPLQWFRGLCDEAGTTPCCYDNQCQNRTLEECACPDCYDMRSAIQAEFGTWSGEEKDEDGDGRNCDVRRLSVDQICEVLEGATLYFIGDSFVRHVYTALLLYARQNELSGAISPITPPGIKVACAGIYMFTEKTCRHWLDRTTSICHGKTRVKFLEYVYIKQAPSIHRAVMELLNKTRSLVFIGTGIHDNFNANDTKTTILKPLLQQLRNVTYPRILWAATHAPGLLKTPRIQEQSYESIRRYNKEISDFLSEFDVPVFDTFNMTDGVMSFDGAHYGMGVNKVKVRVLLAYLLELYLKHLW